MNIEEICYGHEPAASQLATLIREHAAMKKTLAQIRWQTVDGEPSMAALLAQSTLEKLTY
jgi:hypothetical protein